MRRGPTIQRPTAAILILIRGEKPPESSNSIKRRRQRPKGFLIVADKILCRQLNDFFFDFADRLSVVFLLHFSTTTGVFY